MNQDKYLTVSAINRYIKHKLDVDEHLRIVFLKGEISNFKAHTSGHFYFSVKDETGKINAIMFQSYAKKVTFKPVDGSKVLITGRVTMYEGAGSLQIVVEEMLEDGVGNLYIAFEKLKKKLYQEGLFRPEHKLMIPKIPKRVGVITASTGAAIRDIVTTIHRRFPICEVILFPSLVQGENASLDIVRNIELASHYDLDVLIIGRGGGSIEDLWPFNEEIVARAIYQCTIPTISAVGHEVDFTIADFVADLRAPTPTAAAELAVPNIEEIERQLVQFRIRLTEGFYKNIRYQQMLLESYKNSFVIKKPMIMYENKRQSLDLISQKCTKLMFLHIEHSQKRLEQYKKHYFIVNPSLLYKDSVIRFHNLIEKLEIVNPLGVLKRGYAVVSEGRQVIKSVKDTHSGQLLKIRMVDGDICTKVVEGEK